MEWKRAVTKTILEQLEKEESVRMVITKSPNAITISEDGVAKAIFKIKREKTLTIYTDGSCLGNPGSGGWAIYCEQTKESEGGGILQTTNNRMEATAVLKALEYAKRKNANSIKICSDSRLIVEQTNGNWRINKNKDIMDKIMSLKKEFEKLEISWIKGHDGNDLNERVDNLAKEEAKAIS